MFRPHRPNPTRRPATRALPLALVLASVLAAPSLAVPGAATAQAPAEAPAQAPTPIDVNTATAEQLDALPGVGPAKVEAILRLRAERPFRRLTDLLRVPGIGRATLERLRPYLAFPAAAAPARGRAAHASTR